MKIEVEYELNRGYIYNEDGEAIGETNFVVPTDWFVKMFGETIWGELETGISIGEFLEVYDPSNDGEFIYQEAIKDGVLIEDLGIVMY